MTLAAEEVVHYLLERELIRPEVIVDGTLTVSDVSRRNQNFKVESESGSYLLKQGSSPYGSDSVMREADTYRWLWRPENASVHQYLPRVHGYVDQVLVLELVKDAENLNDYHRRRGDFPMSLSSDIGSALAALHQLPLPGDRFNGDELPIVPDWSLSVHRPTLDHYAGMSGGNMEVLRIIQGNESFMHNLDTLLREWRPNSFIHFDLRWDNCLLPRPSRGSKQRLKIIDWEFAGIGDARWDVAYVLADYLSFWVQSMPVTGDTRPEKLPALATYPLHSMHPALEAFWRSYVSGGGSQVGVQLSTTVHFVAVHLIEAALVQTQMASDLDVHSILLVQLAANILERPDTALQLLGLD